MPHPPVIIPEIGGGKETHARDTIKGMDQLGQLVSEIKPETIIFISPHGNSFNNGTCILNKETIRGDFSVYGYPDVEFEKKINQSLAMKISDSFDGQDFVSVLMDDELAEQYGVEVTLDNGVMVPMYFIDQYHANYDMVHITPGGTSLQENYCLGQRIQEVIKEQNKSVLLVCSGDLSHALKDEGPYDFHPSGAVFDQIVKDAITDKDPLSLLTLDDEFVKEAGQCGLRSFLIGFGFLDGMGYDANVLSYEGPFGVGYLTGYLTKNEKLIESSLLPKLVDLTRTLYQEKISVENDYIKLARLSIDTYVKTNRKLDFEKVKGEFSNDFIQEAQGQRAGIFVSIHSNGELRGCIGTISPTQENIIEEIIYNGISASSNDPRFNAVEQSELLELDIKVDVLMEPERILSKDELDVVQYGVIVEKGSKRGLLLPNLDGVDTVQDQIEIAMSKAGITDESEMEIYRFRVTRHEIASRHTRK